MLKMCVLEGLEGLELYNIVLLIIMHNIIHALAIVADITVLVYVSYSFLKSFFAGCFFNLECE